MFRGLRRDYEAPNLPTTQQWNIVRPAHHQFARSFEMYRYWRCKCNRRCDCAHFSMISKAGGSYGKLWRFFHLDLQLTYVDWVLEQLSAAFFGPEVWLDLTFLKTTTARLHQFTHIGALWSYDNQLFFVARCWTTCGLNKMGLHATQHEKICHLCDANWPLKSCDTTLDFFCYAKRNTVLMRKNF